jgi:co-chaperonin GroES (HSP10)
VIKVCGHRLLVKPILLEETDDVLKSAKLAGIEIIRDDVKREAESVDQGVVVQIGTTAWKDFNSDPWCDVGDKIVYAKYAGKLIIDPDTKEKYVALNDEDVVAIVGEST